MRTCGHTSPGKGDATGKIADPGNGNKERVEADPNRTIRSRLWLEGAS